MTPRLFPTPTTGYGDNPLFLFYWFVVAILFLPGCGGTKQVKIDPALRAELKGEKEIKAIHYPRYKGLPTSGTQGGKLSPEPLVQDPLIEVQERFLSEVGAVLDLTNIRVIDEVRMARTSPAIGGPLPPLKRSFIKGYLFDFDPIWWTLKMVQGWLPNFKWDSVPAYLEYRVRARLIDIENEKVVWQSICNIGYRVSKFFDTGSYSEPVKERNTVSELLADDYALLKIKSSSAAKICADQLVSQFLEKEPAK